MANVHISKSSMGRHETSFRVPLFCFRIAARVLPDSALRGMARHGFDVRGIITAAASGTPYRATFHVREHSRCKRIDITAG